MDGTAVAACFGVTCSTMGEGGREEEKMTVNVVLVEEELRAPFGVQQVVKWWKEERILVSLRL